jgi:hypothetical protein
MSKRFFAIVIAGALALVLQLTLASTASAVLYSGDWNSRPFYQDDTGEAGGNAYDIDKLRWAYESGYYFFRVELVAAPTLLSDFKVNIGLPPERNFGSFSIDGNNWSNHTSGSPLPVIAGFDHAEGGGKYLEWKVSLPGVSGPITWWAQTTGYSGSGLGDVFAGTMTTPIPNAAWLFGTGVIALIGLKRRKASGRNPVN